MSTRRSIYYAVQPLTAAAVFLIGWFLTSCAFHPDRQDVPAADQLPAGVQELFISTGDGEQLQCYWLPRPFSSRALIYFPTNTGNIAQRMPELLRLAELGINVLGVNYRGFGKSTGSPSERGLYMDGDAALDYLLLRGFKSSRIFLLGRSLGTAVAVEVAKERDIGGLILVAPLTSGKAMAQAHGYGPLAYFAGDAYDNLRRIGKIRCPLLIVHGTEDEGAPIDMGRRLFAAAPEPKQFVPIPGAHHSDIERFAPDQYWPPIEDFIAAGDRRVPEIARQRTFGPTSQKDFQGKISK